MDVRRFPRGQDALSENPAGSADPAQRAGREGGVCFFAPGFFAQAKKGGSRRHGAKALDVDLQPADEERSRAARCARPSSGASRHLLPQAGEGLAIGLPRAGEGCSGGSARPRSEEHTSELQSLMRISYAVLCLKKKNK